MKIIADGNKLSYRKYGKYTTEDKTLRIEKRYDESWATWDITVYGEVIAYANKLDEVKAFLNKYANSSELVGKWYLNRQRKYDINNSMFRD